MNIGMTLGAKSPDTDKHLTESKFVSFITIPRADAVGTQYIDVVPFLSWTYLVFKSPKILLLFLNLHHRSHLRIVER